MKNRLRNNPSIYLVFLFIIMQFNINLIHSISDDNDIIINQKEEGFMSNAEYENSDLKKIDFNEYYSNQDKSKVALNLKRNLNNKDESIVKNGIEIEDYKNIINKNASNPYLNNKNNDLERYLQTDTTDSPDEYSNIRIYIDYTTLNEQTEITETYRSYLKKIIQKASEAMSILVKVKPRSLNLYIQTCHPEIKINYGISGMGILADLVIFPIVNDVAKTDNIIQAKYCALDEISDRPIGGYLIFNNYLDMSRSGHLEYNTLNVIHGLIHILGFDEDLYDYFIDSQGNKITKESVALELSPGVMSIVAEKVIETAKIYFNCSSIIKIPIISQKLDNSIATHWKARYMLGDIMTDDIYDERVISEITLAFLENTGWYKINYYTGGLFRFGKGGGCKFTSSQCINNDYIENTNEFCQHAGYSMCTPGRLGKGTCFVSDNLSIDNTSYKYFDSEKMGGPAFIDYCPVSVGNRNEDSYFYNSCAYGKAENSNRLGEVVGEDTSCFLSNYVSISQTQELKTLVAVCYQYQCDFNTNTYQIRVNLKWFTCPSNGKLSSSNYYGNLYCPSFDLICTTKRMCSSVLDCIYKFSVLHYDSNFTVNYKLNAQNLKLDNDTTEPTYRSPNNTNMVYLIEGEKTNVIVSVENTYTVSAGNNNTRRLEISYYLKLSALLYYVFIF